MDDSPQNKNKFKNKRPPKQSKYYAMNYMMKSSTISRSQINNEKVLKLIFEYNDLEYKSSYLGIIQNFSNRCFDENINLMPVINSLKKLNEISKIENEAAT